MLRLITWATSFPWIYLCVWAGAVLGGSAPLSQADSGDSIVTVSVPLEVRVQSEPKTVWAMESRKRVSVTLGSMDDMAVPWSIVYKGSCIKRIEGNTRIVVSVPPEAQKRDLYLSVKVKPTTSFPYKGRGYKEFSIKSLDAKPLTLHLERVKVTWDDVMVEIRSGAFNTPVADLQLVCSGKKYTTDGDGMVILQVNKGAREVAIGSWNRVSMLARRTAERLPRTIVGQAALKRAIKTGQAVRLKTEVPLVVGTIVSSVDHQVIPLDGYVSFEHVLGPERTSRGRLWVDGGVFFVHQGSSFFTPGISGTIVGLCDGPIAESFILTNPVKYTVPKKLLRQIRIPVVAREDVSLTMRVSDGATGKPLSGAHVRMAGKKEWSGNTDGKGKVEFDGIPMGHYALNTSVEGYESRRTGVFVFKDGARFDITLRKTVDLRICNETGQEMKYAIIIPLVRGQKKEFGARFGGKKIAVIKGVPEGRAIFAMSDGNGVIKHIGQRAVRRKEGQVMVRSQDLVDVDVDIVDAPRSEESHGLILIDRKTGMSMRLKDLSRPFRGAIPKREYRAFAVMREGCVEVGTLDLRKKHPHGKAMTMRYKIPEKPRFVPMREAMTIYSRQKSQGVTSGASGSRSGSVSPKTPTIRHK